MSNSDKNITLYKIINKSGKWAIWQSIATYINAGAYYVTEPDGCRLPQYISGVWFKSPEEAIDKKERELLDQLEGQALAISNTVQEINAFRKEINEDR